MAKAMEFKASGIKCDNQACDYIDKSVPHEAYPEYVNKPCPKCGENLFQGLQSAAEFLNGLFGELPEPTDDSKVKGMHVSTDGTGNVTFKLK